MPIRSNRNLTEYYDRFSYSGAGGPEPVIDGTGSNYSIDLDGNDSITIPNGSGAIDIADNDFTLECFFRASTSGSPGTHDTLFAL